MEKSQSPNIIFEEILKQKGITPNTKFQTYDYLYKSMIESMKEVYNLALDNAVENVLIEVVDINNIKTITDSFQAYSDNNKVTVYKHSISTLKIL